MAETGDFPFSPLGVSEYFLSDHAQPGDDWREVSGAPGGGERPDLATQGQSPHFEDAVTDGSDEYPHANDGQGGQDFYDHYRGGTPNEI